VLGLGNRSYILLFEEKGYHRKESFHEWSQKFLKHLNIVFKIFKNCLPTYFLLVYRMSRLALENLIDRSHLVLRFKADLNLSPIIKGIFNQLVWDDFGVHSRKIKRSTPIFRSHSGRKVTSYL